MAWAVLKALSTLRPATILLMILLIAHARPTRADEELEGTVPSNKAEAGTTASPKTAHDYLFPKAGGWATSLATGVPFVALGEVAYGIGDRFALGVMGGATPVVMGIGVRPRVVVFDAGNLRSVVTMPILYYPKTSTGDPWVLARPTALMEYTAASGVRLSGGLGGIGAACTDSLFSLGRTHSKTVMGGLWNTVAAGGAFAISGKTSLFAEATAVLRGVQFAGREWVGGPPVIAEIGVATTL
jgi:hypothetical protein